MTKHCLAASATLLALYLSTTPRVVTAQGTPSQKKDTVVWQADSKSSDQQVIKGVVVRAIEVDSVIVSARIDVTANPMPIEVTVMNRSSRRLNVVPKEFALFSNNPKKPRLEYVSPEQIVKKIENDAGGAAAADGGVSVGRSINGRVTQAQGRTTGPEGSIRVSRTGTARDSVAGDVSTSDIGTGIVNSADEEQAAQMTGAMLANMLFTNNVLSGRVYFKRDPLATVLTLCVPIKGKVACIPLDVPKK